MVSITTEQEVSTFVEFRRNMDRNWPGLKSYESGNKAALITSGASYFQLLCGLIREAKKSIHLQVYILYPDDTGLMVLNALKEAAVRGVKIYLVLDGFGSSDINGEIKEDLEQHGIWIRKFGPLHLSRLRIGRRLHHKILIVDSEKALVSGINISDNYYGRHSLPWLDFGIMLEGPVCQKLEKICSDILNRRIELIKKENAVEKIMGEDLLCRVVTNDFLRRRRGIIKSYRSAFRAAKSEILIVAGYFLPGRVMRSILRKASLRDVQITILVSHRSDVRVAGRATHYLYSWLLELGARIYEYNPTVVHGKVAMVDQYWMTVGSYNLNDLSELTSVETNVDLISPSLCQSSRDLIMKFAHEDCTEITAERFRKHATIFSRSIDFLAYLLVRISFRIYFLLTKNDRHNTLE